MSDRLQERKKEGLKKMSAGWGFTLGFLFILLLILVILYMSSSMSLIFVMIVYLFAAFAVAAVVSFDMYYFTIAFFLSSAILYQGFNILTHSKGLIKLRVRKEDKYRMVNPVPGRNTQGQGSRGQGPRGQGPQGQGPQGQGSRGQGSRGQGSQGQGSQGQEPVRM